MKLHFVLALCMLACGCVQSASHDSEPAPPLTIASGVVYSTRLLWNQQATEFFFDGETRPAWLIRHESGDLRFESKTHNLLCRKYSTDSSTIVDLGEKTWNQIDELPSQKPSGPEAAAAVVGHVYLVRINDTRVDFWALVKVVAIVGDERCIIEWARVDAGAYSTKPAIAAATQQHLARLLDGQDRNLDASLVLQSPRILLQVRAGATGGNPSRVDMLGHTTAFVDRMSPTPLAFDAAPKINDRSIAYFSGGHVPFGKCLVINKITFQGSAAGDTNGHGEFILHAGHTEIAKERNIPTVPGGKWEGHIEVLPGEEQLVYVEIANSSAANVVIEGEFIDYHYPARRDSGVDTALSEQEPRAILQVRAGAAGGNPSRIDMVGHKSIYIPIMSTTPLSFATAPTRNELGVAYVKGCRIPPGKKLVIKTIHYSASGSAESDRHGVLILHVGSNSIVNLHDVTELPTTTWEGKIEIRRDHEETVYLEVANCIMANVQIDGEFANDPRPTN